jgi:hypothetical protein
VQDSGDNPPIIDAPSPRLVLGKVGLERHPLLVAQPKQLAHHHPNVHKDIGIMICP